MNDPRRTIPSVDRLLASEAFGPLLAGAPRPLVRDALRLVLDEYRGALERSGGDPEARGATGGVEGPVPGAEDAWFAARTSERLEALLRPSLRPVINATGVVLHTNLGRAPLAEEALAAVRRAAAGFSNLEYDLERGGRGSR